MKRTRIFVLVLVGRRRTEAKYATPRIATVDSRESIVVWSIRSEIDLGCEAILPCRMSMVYPVKDSKSQADIYHLHCRCDSRKARFGIFQDGVTECGLIKRCFS